MTTTLKNGMYVTPPKGKFIDIKYCKKYQVSSVSVNDLGIVSFSIIDDFGDTRYCLLNNCLHINNLNWKIVEL